MNILILPGFSLKNRAWADETKFTLEKKGLVGVETYEWKHWQTGANDDFSSFKEAQMIINLIKDSQISIVAKSIGTLVACRILSSIPSQINKAVFCGIPLNDLTEEEKSAYEILDRIPQNRLTFIQNSDDSHGSHEEVGQFLGNIIPGKQILEKESSTHEYAYYQEIYSYLK